MDIKKEFAIYLNQGIDNKLSLEEIESLLEKPKQLNQGDLAFPCFQLAKVLKRPPHEIAKKMASFQTPSTFEKIETVGGYVNAFLNKKLITHHVITTILKEKENYGSHTFGKDKTICMDLSSPNIAKPFSMGHLRSTVIGSAISNISEKCGYETVKINYIGDWGTQFGKLITAYKKWGNEVLVKENPIKELTDLYVKFHEEADKDPSLNDEGRLWFKKLEDGDVEARKLWTWFREVSLTEFQKIYSLLGIQFDSYNGEAFYNDKMQSTVDELVSKNLLIESEGAQIVKIGNDLPPCLIKKSDGATLYATRDITAARYRKNKYQFDKAFYIVGHEQSLHFEQIKRVLTLMGYEWSDKLEHIPFGLILKDGKKMSTRKGGTVLLENVLSEAIRLAKKNILEKNPDLEAMDEVAKQVGVGAVIFHDLKNDKGTDVEFSLEQMLKFEGDTGPYVQYTAARIQTLLSRGHVKPSIDESVSIEDESWELITTLKEFPSVVSSSFIRREPSVISKYLITLCHRFNHYYGKVRILNDEDTNEKLALSACILIVIKEGLRLLGIETPAKM